MHPPHQFLSHAKTSSHFPDGHQSQPKWLPSKAALLWQPVCTYRCSTVVHRSTCCLPDSAVWRCLPASLRADTSTGSLNHKSSCGCPILPRSGVCQGHRSKWLQATVRKRGGVNFIRSSYRCHSVTILPFPDINSSFEKRCSLKTCKRDLLVELHCHILLILRWLGNVII